MEQGRADGEAHSPRDQTAAGRWGDGAPCLAELVCKPDTLRGASTPALLTPEVQAACLGASGRAGGGHMRAYLKHGDGRIGDRAAQVARVVCRRRRGAVDFVARRVALLELGEVAQQRGLLAEVLEGVLADVQLVAGRVRLREGGVVPGVHLKLAKLHHLRWKTGGG